MSLTAIKKEYQSAILDGMARTLWVMAYADWAHGQAICETCDAPISRDDNGTWLDQSGDPLCYEGARHVPSTTQGPNVASAGENWEEASPETPDAAYLAARDLGKLYRASEGLSLPDLFELAMTVDVGEFQFEQLLKTRIKSPPGKETRRELAEEFGGDLAHMALGSGSWFDRHKQTRLGARFDPKIPSFECHYDGEELTWSGAQGTHGIHRARYDEGQIEEADKIGGIVVINANDKSWTKHRYVIALGAYGDTKLLVYANGVDSAIDEVIDWAVENAPGHIIDDSVNEEYQRAKAEGMNDEKAWEEAEADTISGGNAGNHLNAAEVFILAEDPDRDQLLDLAGMGALEVNPAARNPAGLTEKGERMYEQIRAGYAAVGNQRAKEIAARTVLSRAKHGGRGLLKPARQQPRQQRKRRKA